MRKGLILSSILLFLALIFLALTLSTPILAIIDLIGLPIFYFKLRKKELNWNFKLINIGLFVFIIISLSIFGQTAESSKKEVAVNTTTVESTDTKDEPNTEGKTTEEEPKVEETKASTPAATNEENKETSNVKPETTVSTNNSSNNSSSSNSNVKFL